MGTDSSPAVGEHPWRDTAAHVFVADLETLVLDSESAHHLGRVLRLRPDEAICASDGSGAWRLCRLDAAGELVAEGGIARTEPTVPALTVGFAALKGSRNELVVQKLTELGVDRIWLLQCEHSVVRWDASRAHGHLDRLHRVATEASGQCRRLRLPELDVLSLSEALDRAHDEETDGSAPAPVMADAGGRGLTGSDTVILVGPEGGWSEKERGRATSVALGEHVLRAETAAIVAGATAAQLRVGLMRPGL